MTRPSSRMWWIVIPAYLFGGLVPGLADGEIGRMIQALGVRPGIATAVCVNILLPLVAVGLAVAVPLLRTVWLGAVAMTAGYIIGLATVHPRGGPVNAIELLLRVPPVLVLACLGYGILGTFAALITRRLSRAPANHAICENARRSAS